MVDVWFLPALGRASHMGRTGFADAGRRAGLLADRGGRSGVILGKKYHVLVAIQGRKGVATPPQPLGLVS